MNKIILLVDDDIDDKELFCEAMLEVDPTIICHYAPDGYQAMEKLNEIKIEKPSLIFLDINMPRMDGWQFLNYLKNHDEYKDIRVLMYSTSSHVSDINMALKTGALCFFTKPSNFQLLKDILKTITSNLDGDLLSAISHFNEINDKEVFACND